MQKSPNQQQSISHTQAQYKFIRFKDWFKSHGGLERGINFPVRFDPGDYLGISAKTQVTPNTVILAVPKQIVVSVSRARQSQLKEIYKQQSIFGEEDNEDSDYNVLCLYLIMQKMKGTKSFFHPYIQLLDSSETVMNWSNPQIQSINDPYINLKFIDSIRATFQPIYQAFLQIAQKNKHLFPQQLTRKMFDEIYAAVMTRGFGWGLPQTMLVPYADFLNHSSTGVNHYVFDRCLEDSTQENSYIKKKYQLNLSLFPSIHTQTLPIDYEPNLREAYIRQNLHKLKQMNLVTVESSAQTRMDPTITNPLYNMLVQPIIEDDFDDQVYLSTDSQDNDSDSEAEGLEESEQIDGKGQPTSNKLGTVLMTRKYLRYAFKLVDKEMDERFTEPKPNVNAEFEEGVKFEWWFQNHQKEQKAYQSSQKTQGKQKQHIQINKQPHQINQPSAQQQQLSLQKTQTKQKQSNQIDKSPNQSNNPLTQEQQQQQTADKYFIVSTSRKLYPNQQIYNCYGRRSNRFLLIWYGFCFQHNKYDSVPFRLWSSEITKRTGHALYTRFLTQTQYRESIPIGNQRFNAYMLSEEFRLKSRRVDYKLMAFLRYRFLSANRLYKEYYKAKEWHVNRVTAVHMEIECWLEYQRHLNILKGIFGVKERQEFKQREQKKKLQKENIQSGKLQKENIQKEMPEKELSEGYQFNAYQQSTAREYFKSILQKSNQQIIVKNILAVNQILKVLYQIQTHLQKQQNPQQQNPKAQKTSPKHSPITWQILPKHLLLHLYQTGFNESQKQHPELYERLDAVCSRSRSTIRKQLKLMIREYFKILSKSEVCRTLYTEFR